MSVVCVTGTDTEVGKTLVTAALGAALVAQGRSVVAIKPVESGVALDGIEDGALLAEATGQRAPLQALTRLQTPVAPPLAADRDGVRLEPARWGAVIADHARACDVTLVEGAGGLLSPLTWTKSLRDLARTWQATAIVVGLDKLGTLNHTLMTLELLEAAGVRPLGVVLNTVGQDNSTGANAAALKRVRPFLEVVTVPHVASWRDAIPVMAPVTQWLPR
ncbi:MAG: dethiobiotin synthase [Myxococcota bacterium]